MRYLHTLVEYALRLGKSGRASKNLLGIDGCLTLYFNRPLYHQSRFGAADGKGLLKYNCYKGDVELRTLIGGNQDSTATDSHIVGKNTYVSIHNNVAATDRQIGSLESRTFHIEANLTTADIE